MVGLTLRSDDLDDRLSGLKGKKQRIWLVSHRRFLLCHGLSKSLTKVMVKGCHCSIRT